MGRLEGEGLVVKTHLVGYSAAPQITRRHFEELYELALFCWSRMLPGVPRDVINRRQHAQADRDRRTDAKAGQRRERLNYSGFARLDAELHDQIMEIAGNELIRDTLEHLHTHFHIFRLMFHARVTEEALTEHESLLGGFVRATSRRAEARDARAHRTLAPTSADGFCGGWTPRWRSARL